MTKTKTLKGLALCPQRGRPTLYTETLATEITDRLSTGEALSWICRDAHMPAVRTVNSWAEQRAEFSASFARARKEGFNAIAERCRETARGRGDSTGDVYRDRMIIETDLKLLARWWPQLYGARAELVHSGDHHKAASEMTDAELLERLRAFDDQHTLDPK